MGGCLSNDTAVRAAGGGPTHEAALFFPDDLLPCRNARNGSCNRTNCKFSHDRTSLWRLLDVIESASASLDICVFSITCDDIANAVIAVHKRGVRVRVITDDDQMDAAGSDIRRMAAEGVPVCDDNSRYHMHNKFAIVDRRLLLSGSFNWTRSAVLNNRENILVTDSPSLVSAFCNEFDKLWALYYK
eukprot:TRINITY_DN1963_c0_g1_i1.p1 TRINITY_DN1963_c0_g1~~TRINITY_DN1963_c0_g1_i1.p1  ORF type:complete len:187 (+),score=52.59 TRINITY_DN1963_c0_g1_i1:232-792(+)